MHENKDNYQCLLSSALSIPVWEGWVKQESYSLRKIEIRKILPNLCWCPWLGWARWLSANHLCTSNGCNFMLLGCWMVLPRPPWEMSSAALGRNIKISTRSKMCPTCSSFTKSLLFALLRPLLGTIPTWQLGSGCTDLLVILQDVFISIGIHWILFPLMWIKGFPSIPPLFYFVFCAAPVLTALVMEPLGIPKSPVMMCVTHAWEGKEMLLAPLQQKKL